MTERVLSHPPPLVIRRRFAAPREAVLRAWSTAEHIQRWFSPGPFTIPEARVEFREGGEFFLVMRGPGFPDHAMRTRFTELKRPERLVFEGAVEFEGADRFRLSTLVEFAAEGPETLMTVTQSYDILDPDFRRAVDGAPEGWRSTLDKLEALLKEPPAAVAPTHGQFTLSRLLRASPAQVFATFANPAVKAKWFPGNPAFTQTERSMDVRPGGRERLKGRWPQGLVTCFDAVYFDVVENERLVYAYEMHLDERKISVSLATLTMAPEGEGTRLTVTEQGAFLNGYADGGARETGTAGLLDGLARWLEPSPPA